MKTILERTAQAGTSVVVFADAVPELGPALGERVAAWVLGREEPLAKFALARLKEPQGPERSQLEAKDEG